MSRPEKSDPVFGDLDNKVKYVLARSCLSPSGYRQLRYFVADFFHPFFSYWLFRLLFWFWWPVPLGMAFRTFSFGGSWAMGGERNSWCADFGVLGAL